MKRLIARNTSTGAIVADRVGVAATRADRAVGLLSRSGLNPGEALWIVPSRGVHTCGMRFPIDVIALDGTTGPSTRLIDGGTVATTSTGWVTATLGTPYVLPAPGWYALGGNADAGSAAASIASVRRSRDPSGAWEGCPASLMPAGARGWTGQGGSARPKPPGPPGSAGTRRAGSPAAPAGGRPCRCSP